VEGIFQVKKLEYEYLRAPIPGKTAGERALEDLLRMRPEPPLHDVKGMRAQQETAMAALFPISGAVTVERVKIKYVTIPPPIID